MSRLRGLIRPGVFGLSDSVLLTDAFRSAGFREVNVLAVSHVHRAASAQEFIRKHEGVSTGAMGEALSRLTEEGRKLVLVEIIQALQKYEGSNGFEAPGESLLVVGTK